MGFQSGYATEVLYGEIVCRSYMGKMDKGSDKASWDLLRVETSYKGDRGLTLSLWSLSLDLI